MNWKGQRFVWVLVTLVSTILLASNGSAEAKKYNLRKFYPLRQGVMLVYLQTYADGHKNYEIVCVGGTEKINGTITKKEWEFDSGGLDDGDYEYTCMSWTGEGLKVYKEVDSDGSYSIVDPPLILIPNRMSIGETSKHTVTYTDYNPDHTVKGSGSYTSEFTLVGKEDIEVRGRTFKGCLKFSEKGCEGEDCEEYTVWLARRIGIVKDTSVDEERELLSFTMEGRTYYPLQ